MLNTNNQNSIIFKSMDLQQKLQDRHVFEQFLNKAEHVTCDKPKGYLVKENPVQQFGSMFVDTGKDIKNLGKALSSGKSNDLELGRMNDIGMKIGGGIIAAALMGSRTTNCKKLMELAGFGTFFTVMSLWPKLAIDLPTKIRHGFNPHQKYIDSQGRKKQFFQDNQYLPWDVWSKEDINKVADRMNVPKDLKDREEYTKEKMRTIALQDNTLWMLTAGFATPLLTSLACNRIEEGLRVPVANAQLRSLMGEVGNMDTLVNAALSDAKTFGAQDAAVEEMLTQLRNGVVPENFDKKLGEIFNLTRFSTNEEVNKGIRRASAANAQDLIERILPQNRSFVDSGILERIIGDDAQAVSEAKKIFKEAYQLAEEDVGKNFSFDDVMQNVKGILFTRDDLDGKAWVEKISSLSEDKVKALGTSTYDKKTLQESANILETLYKKGIKPVQAQMKVFGDKLTVLDGISGEKYNRTARKFVKLLELSDQEISIIRNSTEMSSDEIQNILASKISKLAATGNDEKYQKALEALRKEQLRLDKTRAKGTLGAKIKQMLTKLTGGKTSAIKETSIDEVFRTMTGGVSDRMSGVVDEAFGKDAEGILEGSGIKETLKRGLSEHEIAKTRSNITSVDSVVTKMFNALTIERKIQDGTLLGDWQKYANGCGFKGSISDMPAEEIENFYKICRRVAWQSSYSDMMNKGYTAGNGEFYKNLVRTIFNTETDDAAIKDWRVAARSIAESPTFIPNDALSFNGDINKWNDVCASRLHELKVSFCTAQGIKIEDLDTDTYKDVVKNLEEQAKSLTDQHFATMRKSHGIKFAEFGESTLTTIKKQVNQMYNDRKWMKVFGGLTVALIGVTLVSQLFFGKVKNSHLYEREPQKDTFESGK